MSKIFIYSDNDSDVSWENVFLSTKYKDLKHFEKENPDLRPIVSYNIKDVIGVDVDKLEQELAKLKNQLEVAEAVLSVQVTKSALAYFEDKRKLLENNVTEN